MRYLADFIMFCAGLSLGVYLFESTLYGILAGLILAGATDSALGGRKPAR